MILSLLTLRAFTATSSSVMTLSGLFHAQSVPRGWSALKGPPASLMTLAKILPAARARSGRRWMKSLAAAQWYSFEPPGLALCQSIVVNAHLLEESTLTEQITACESRWACRHLHVCLQLTWTNSQ